MSTNPFAPNGLVSTGFLPAESTSAELIDIKGLDKAHLLQALHAAARLPLIDPPESALPITQAEAEWYIENCRSSGAILYYARIGGRVMKVDITGDTLDPTHFDTANGAGAAQAAVDHLDREREIAGQPWAIQNEKLQNGATR